MSARIVPLADVHPRPRTVALGTFDGVHIGHQAVLRDADTVVTFHPHPMTVLAPGRVPPQLTTLDRKARVIGDLGVQELVLVPFTRETASRSAESFVEEVLVGRLDARGVRVGENFRFGHEARGTPAVLQADTRFDTTVVPVLRRGGETVSSTRVRELVARGAVGEAHELLGVPFALSGPVEHGERRGRGLGFPTANLVPPKAHALPAHGVYACRAQLQDGSVRTAAVSIGIRPQFESALGVLIEAHLLDYDGDLYGEQVELEFLQRLRGEQRFDGVDELVAQIDRDVEAVRRIAAG